MVESSNDRIPYWPIILAVGCPVAFVLLLANLFAGSLLLAPLVLLLWFGASVVAAVIAPMVVLEWGFRRAWRRFSSMLILPATVLLAVVSLGSIWDAGRWAGNYVHLFALYPHYMAEISRLPPDGARFRVWPWMDTTPCSSGLAYDESDAIASGHRWETNEQIGTVDVYGDSRAFGHFYFATFC